MFRRNELKALELLLKKDSIPVEFFLYWNDAVNTIGYSAKLLIMFFALEALVKHKMGLLWSNPHLRNSYREKIIGKRLLEKFYAPGHSVDGLRNRLNHGEYLSGDDVKKNYVDIMHKRIIRYFNNRVLRKKLINADVKNPQRHILPQKRSESRGFVRRKRGVKVLNLKGLLKSMDPGTRLFDYKKYGWVSGSFTGY
jgi:hypothetical protein